MSPSVVDLDALTWRPDLASREISRERLDAIAFTPMSARVRNELITRTYGDLAQAMAGLLGTNDATWAAFGQWASTTIGGYLSLRIPVLGDLIGQAFGDGNRDVFADIGRAHTTFLASVGRAYVEGTDLPSAWAQCADELQRRLFSPPGGPLDATAEGFWRDTLDPRSRPDGPRYNLLLVLGFRAYYHALQTVDPERRSRSILLGNCLIGLHEQRLLARAISAGFRSWLRTSTAPWRLLQPRARWLGHVPGGWQLRLESFWIHLATRHFIGVRLPWGTVRIGAAVPVGERPVEVLRASMAGSKSGHKDSRPVRSLSDDELLGQAFERFSVTGEPAECWGNLRSRMAYIMAVFARHQRSVGWFDQDGRVVRPDPLPGWEGELHVLLTDLDRAPVDPPTPNAPDSLAADLDRLRTEPSFIPLDENVLDAVLDQSTLTDEQRRQFYRSLSADVAGRLDALSQPGGLLDADTCRLARSLFRRWSTLLFMGLLLRSLPDSYAAAAGVRVLGEISTLATDPFRRAGETVQFVLDLLGRDEGWGTAGLRESDAYRSVVGVRAMHAIIAARLLDEGWDQTRYGLPLNAEDVLGTALTFAVSPLEMLDTVGVDVKGAQRDAWVRFWLGIGHLLGAPHDFLTTTSPSGRVPLDYPQARTLAQVFRRRHHARSLDGVRLGEAILAGVADGFPRWTGWLPAGLMQVLGDPRVVQLLLLGRSEGRRRAAAVAAIFRLLLTRRFTRPLGRVLVRLIGYAWLRPFLHQGRSRPYRRPLRQHDRARVSWLQQVAQAWPADCTGHRGH